MRFQFVSKTDEHKLPQCAENTNINFIVNASVYSNLFHSLPFVARASTYLNINANVLLTANQILNVSVRVHTF